MFSLYKLFRKKSATVATHNVSDEYRLYKSSKLRIGICQQLSQGELIWVTKVVDTELIKDGWFIEI